MPTTDDVLDLVAQWTAAEADNAAGRIDPLLAPDFVGIGPLGYVLEREHWLGRFDDGLANTAFAVEHPQVHDHDTAAVVVGILVQQTTLRGSDISGRFRTTLVAVRPARRWLLAGVHIGQPRPVPSGAPPSR